jgi:hypothetical protein
MFHIFQRYHLQTTRLLSLYVQVEDIWGYTPVPTVLVGGLNGKLDRACRLLAIDGHRPLRFFDGIGEGCGISV